MVMKNYYVPSFSISNRMLQLVSDISALAERVQSLDLWGRHPRLRRNNRIRSIHSSLRIEANSLSLDDVRDVLNNRYVVGPKQEVQEVKNAFAAYDNLEALNPWSVKDLLRMHGVMMRDVIKDNGKYRTGDEGVFDGKRCIFMAPGPDRVPVLMSDLLQWVKNDWGKVHPLIMSCVFHYEFVFIHPFSDGNGRMARFWQTLILSKWQDLFQYIPVESQIEKFQREYYAVINECNHSRSDNIFVEFMLARIKDVLQELIENDRADVSVQELKLLEVMQDGRIYPAKKLMELLGLKTRATLLNSYLQPALHNGLIEMTLPDKPTSRNQAYKKV